MREKAGKLSKNQHSGRYFFRIQLHYSHARDCSRTVHGNDHLDSPERSSRLFVDRRAPLVRSARNQRYNHPHAPLATHSAQPTRESLIRRSIIKTTCRYAVISGTSSDERLLVSMWSRMWTHWPDSIISRWISSHHRPLRDQQSRAIIKTGFRFMSIFKYNILEWRREKVLVVKCFWTGACRVLPRTPLSCCSEV